MRVRLLAAAAAALFVAPAGAQAADEDWVQRALASQYRLGSDLPFANSPWIGTHNSFNSSSQSGVTLSASDANQRITNVAQLDAGMRSLELDVHRVPDQNGGPIRVCHGRGADQLHFGCTTEKELAPTLAEIVAWLDSSAGAGQVLLLYLEDHMGDAAGYDAAASIVSQSLGPRLYAPPAGSCTEVPQELTRADVLAAGAQVVVVSDCGPGTGWGGVAFNWESHVESRPVEYADFPDCGPDYTREQYDSVFVRYYEDSTALTNVVGPPTGVATPDDGVTPETAAAMARCGVDLIGLDQLSGPSDPRLEALVWSWAPGEPEVGAPAKRRCATQVVGRWRDANCRVRRRPACRRDDGRWVVPKRKARQRLARTLCRRRNAKLAAPRSGHEAQLLRLAMERRGTRQARLGLRIRPSGTPRPLDPR